MDSLLRGHNKCDIPWLKMFYVVQLDSDNFKEKIVVPSIWLDKYDTLCLLPPMTDATEVEALAKDQCTPKHGWQLHNVSFIQSFDTYSQAKEKITKGKPVMIDLEEEEEAQHYKEVRRKRKRKLPRFLEQYSIEFDNDKEKSCGSTPDNCPMKDNIVLDPLIVKVETIEDSNVQESHQLPRLKTTHNENSSSVHSNLQYANQLQVARSTSSTANMEKEKSILVLYNSRCKVFTVPTSMDEFENEVYARFSIDRSVSIVIQLFNESWQEYIDVEKDDILAGKKYRVVLDTPKVLYIEKSLPNYDESDLALHVPASFGINESNTSGSCETSEPDLFAATASEPDPLAATASEPDPLAATASEPDFFAATESQSYFSLHNFTIPTKDFSSRLREALKNQEPLSRVLRSEFIQCICSFVWRYSKYPKSIMFTDLARAIVLQYPHLRESIGTGYDGWRKVIRDKFKNWRRCDLSEEVKRKKKRNITDKFLNEVEKANEKEQIPQLKKTTDGCE